MECKKLVAVVVMLGLGACSKGKMDVVYPDTQREFFSLNADCKTSYGKGINEIQQSLAFNKCNKARSSFARKADPVGWVGTITKISTDQGADVVALDIAAEINGFEITFRTVSNRASDVGSDTLITQDNPLFGVLENMTVGERVMFTGSFLTDPSGDRGIWEASLTERGSMEDPEFNLRFSSIQPYVDGTPVAAPSPTGDQSKLSAQADPESVTLSIPDAVPSSDSAVASRLSVQASEQESAKEEDKPYEQVKSKLLSTGYQALSEPTDRYNMTIDGDPATCGNAGCSIPWRRGEELACVGVTVNDNLGERQWAARIASGSCD